MLHSLPRGNLVVSPEVGIDVGVSKTKGKYLVSSSDPITGTNANMGWHAVNVSANDVATSGIMPDVLNIVALFPVGTETIAIQRVISEISKTASSLGITVVWWAYGNYSWFEETNHNCDCDRFRKQFCDCW